MRPLAPKEETIMQLLWRMKKAFVKEILDELPEPKPPVTTLSSLMRKLDDEGIVGHEQFGRTYRYFPILKKEAYQKSTLQRLKESYFGGSAKALLSYFVEEEELTPAEIEDLLKNLK